MAGRPPQLYGGAFRPYDGVIDEQQAKHLKAALRQLVRFVVDGTSEHFLRKIGEDAADAIDDYLSTRGYEANYVAPAGSGDGNFEIAKTTDDEGPRELPRAPKLTRPVMKDWPGHIRVV